MEPVYETMTYVDVSPRLSRWIARTFPRGSAAPVVEQLGALPAELIGGQDSERIQASLVIDTGGDWDAFQRRLALAKSDWRDALVGAGLGDEDWRVHLDAVLGQDVEDQAE